MKVEQLKIPIWQEIVYLLFTVVIPIVLTCIELFNSRSVIIKWSFASVGSILITFLVIRKFVLRERIEKMRQKIVMLEHDYASGNGNKDSIRVMWKRYNLYLYLYNSILIMLVIILVFIFTTALIDGLIKFKGASLLIMLSVFISLIFRILTFVTYKNKNKDIEDNVEINETKS